MIFSVIPSERAIHLNGMNDSLWTPIINCFRHMPSCWFLLWLLVFNFRYSNSACGYLSDKYGNPIRLSIELETILGIRFSKIVSIFIYLWRCITIAHYSLVAVVLFRTDIVHFVPAGPDTATLMSTAAQCSGTRHRTLTDTNIAIWAQGRGKAG